MIIKDFPPNYGLILQYLPTTKFTIYAYGEYIYNPSGEQIPLDVIEHEKVHLSRQKTFGTSEGWWSKYLLDSTFRLNEELAAYSAQYELVKKHVPTKIAEEHLNELASNLSKLYNLDITIPKAKTAIKKYAQKR